MQTHKITAALVLLPTATIRYKEVKPSEVLLDTILPPEFKLQQLHVDNRTGDFEWQDIPMVPHGTSDTGNIAA